VRDARRGDLEHDDSRTGIPRQAAPTAPQRQTEVEDFIDFLREREAERRLARAAAAASEDAFARVWDNPQDEAYDRL
jgi:erythromycin esterase-like protein